MTPAELAAHGDPDAAIAAMLAGLWRVERRGPYAVAVIPTATPREVAT